MIEWEKLPALEGRNNPCLCCPPIASRLKMNRRVAVGFRYAAIHKDGEPVWHESGDWRWSDLPTLMTFENMARKDPDHDWRAILYGPLHGETYQRHGRNEWVLVESNNGFA